MSQDYAAMHEEYLSDVIAGRIVSCKWIRLAVERELRDREKAERGELRGSLDQEYYFSPDRADRACSFMEMLVLPHGSGRDPLVLMPWQVHAIRSLFGWVYDKDDRQLRRFRHAYWSMARKGSKSTTAAGAALYAFLAEPYDIHGSLEAMMEGYTAATKRDQAKITLKLAQSILSNTPGASRLRGGTKVMKYSIDCQQDRSSFEALSADHGTLDGLNTAVAVVDEYHAHKTDELLEVIRTSQGARMQPLCIITTTAGFNKASSPCFVEEESIRMMLENEMPGVVQEDYQALLWTLDEDDQWDEPSCWVKSNPSLGVTNTLESLQSAYNTARIIQSKVVGFQTKQLNIWSSGSLGFFNMAELAKGAEEGFSFGNLDPEKRTYLGLDVGSTSDLTAVAAVQFEKDGDDILAIDAAISCFIPHERLDLRHGAVAEIYRSAKESGTADLVVMKGNTTDYRLLRDFILGLTNRLNVISIGCDEHQAAQLTTEIAEKKQDLEVIVQAQTARTFTVPLQTAEHCVLQNTLRWSGSPLLNWQFANLEIETKETKATLVLTPIKASGKAKIDAPIAMLNAIAVGLKDDTLESDWYDPYAILEEFDRKEAEANK